jgi:hypothetical protein
MGGEQSRHLQLQIVSDKNVAQSLLDAAEHVDFYLEECYSDRLNAIARKNNTYSANSVSNVIHGQQFLDDIIQQLPKRLLSDLDSVQIVQLMPTADGGMPHTRPNNIICYPDFAQLFSKTTLIHELWHVHQRIYKSLWLSAFKNMGWRLWEGELPERLELARRYNPDTIDCPLWIFDNTWVPVPVFKDITRPKVGEVEIWFYNPERNYHVQKVPSEIASYFPNLPASAYEHPREMAAYMLSEPEVYRQSLGFKKLLEQIGQISIM